jgi:hypothetical protein
MIAHAQKLGDGGSIFLGRLRHNTAINSELPPARTNKDSRPIPGIWHSNSTWPKRQRI